MVQVNHLVPHIISGVLQLMLHRHVSQGYWGVWGRSFAFCLCCGKHVLRGVHAFLLGDLAGLEVEPPLLPGRADGLQVLFFSQFASIGQVEIVKLDEKCVMFPTGCVVLPCNNIRDKKNNITLEFLFCFEHLQQGKVNQLVGYDRQATL